MTINRIASAISTLIAASKEKGNSVNVAVLGVLSDTLEQEQSLLDGKDHTKDTQSVQAVASAASVVQESKNIQNTLPPGGILV